MALGGRTLRGVLQALPSCHRGRPRNITPPPSWALRAGSSGANVVLYYNTYSASRFVAPRVTLREQNGVTMPPDSRRAGDLATTPSHFRHS